MPSLSYQPAREDLLAACRLNHLAGITSRRALAILLADGAFTFALVWFTDGPMDVALFLAGAAMAVLVAALVLLQLVRPRLVARRQFQEQRNLRDAFTIAWSERSYTVRGETVFSDLPWDHYLRWREDARVILLYQSRYFYQYVPKHLLSPGDVEDIRRWLRTAGVPRASRFLS